MVAIAIKKINKYLEIIGQEKFFLNMKKFTRHKRARSHIALNFQEQMKVPNIIISKIKAESLNKFSLRVNEL